jgi:MSHA biogenesis protein MshL
MRKPLLATFLAVLIAGCQTSPIRWSDEAADTINRNLAQAKTATVPSDVSRELMPPLEIKVPDGSTAPLDPRFDIAVSNAPARQVFMGLVEGTPYDMVLPPDLGGTITLNLKNVSVPEAMNAIRTVYGYEYRRDGRRFFVMGREMQTRLFNVNYLNLIRRGKSDTRVTASGLTSTGATSGTTTTTSTSQSGVQIETHSASDFWRDLQATLTSLIGTEGGRRVVVNPMTGIVAVRGMPNDLRVIEEYLGSTHETVNRQVVLEAKIVEVELNNGFQTGINWAKVSGNATFGQVGGGTALTGTGRPGPSEIAGNSGNLNPTTGVFSGISGTNASAFGGIFSIAARTQDFAAFVELLQSQGRVHVLSSPRISTMNNQKAVIKVGTDAFFVTKQDITVTNNTSQVTSELTPFFSGISLDVTPQIDETGNITLHIHPAVSTVTEKKIDTGAVDVSTALSSVQESDNIVRAASGQIIVIGGLMKEGVTDESASVPILGDIPILGYLFKHKRVSRIKRELVILLKPTVIRLDQDWATAVDESQERVKNLNNIR